MPPIRHNPTLVLTLVVLTGLGQVASACAPLAVAGAGAAVGVTASQERGFQGAMSDTRIRVDINHLWFQESELLFSKVNLQVQEGRVLLTGQVPDPQTRVDAVRLSWQVTGVREIINEIEVANDSSLSDRARDTWISTKLKSRLLADKQVASINYSIEVVNQQIYLFVVALDQADLDRVIAHAKVLAYVRRVVSYVRLKDDPALAS